MIPPRLAIGSVFNSSRAEYTPTRCFCHENVELGAIYNNEKEQEEGRSFRRFPFNWTAKRQLAESRRIFPKLELTNIYHLESIPSEYFYLTCNHLHQGAFEGLSAELFPTSECRMTKTMKQAAVQIIKSPHSWDTHLPWTFEPEAFLHWVHTVVDKDSDGRHDIQSGMQNVKDAGYEAVLIGS